MILIQTSLKLLGQPLLLLCVDVPLGLDLFHLCLDLAHPLLPATLLGFEPVNLSLAPLQFLTYACDLLCMRLCLCLPLLLVLALEGVELGGHQAVVPLEELVLRPECFELPVQGLDGRLLLRGQLLLQLKKQLWGCLG